ncbi:cyclic-AMP phosphodiesterase, partial [Dipodascopsis tothii]|uniref:cyclic-AMP phosphodiesterase n=1 Tax=Dipodascopsis tothii TaxID=44089 RepID=UPI0034CE33A6
GASGGPLESGVSGYVVKSVAEPWGINVLAAVDAGTFMAGIRRILQEDTHRRGGPRTAHRCFGSTVLPYRNSYANTAYVAHELVQTVCITHAHLDHVGALALNASSFSHDRPKHVAGLPRVLDAVKDGIFNGLVWPNMTNEGQDPIGLLQLRRIADGASADVARGLTARAFEVSHGCLHSAGQTVGAVPSTAFFLRDKHTGDELLMFGDVEPDSVSIDPRNRRVWHEAAGLFRAGRLRGIVIECSYASCQPESSLFGHMSPPYLIQELKQFAS